MKKQLHLISNGQLSIAELALICRKIEPNVDFIHLREKQKTAREIYVAALNLIQLGIPQNKIIINDRLDVAMALNTAVQLAHHSLEVGVVKRLWPNSYVGCSIHTLEEAKTAEMDGANYLLFGHVFDTASKPNIPGRGIEELQSIRDAVDIPVIAIGGIKPQYVEQVLATGVDGIAVMSGVLGASDPLHAVKQYAHYLNSRGEAGNGRSI